MGEITHPAVHGFALVAVAAMAVAAAGCGGSSASAATVSLERWRTSVCSAIARYQHAVKRDARRAQRPPARVQVRGPQELGRAPQGVRGNGRAPATTRPGSGMRSRRPESRASTHGAEFRAEFVAALRRAGGSARRAALGGARSSDWPGRAPADALLTPKMDWRRWIESASGCEQAHSATRRQTGSPARSERRRRARRIRRPGVARARWPIRSSKPAGRGNPTVGRFDSCAAPLCLRDGAWNSGVRPSTRWLLGIRPPVASWARDSLGVWARVVPDRVVIEVGLGHAEQVSQLMQERVVDHLRKLLPVACRPGDRQTVERDLRGAAVSGEHTERLRLAGVLVLDRDGDVMAGDRRLDPPGQRVELGLRERCKLILGTRIGGIPFLHPQKATAGALVPRQDRQAVGTHGW